MSRRALVCWLLATVACAGTLAWAQRTQKARGRTMTEQKLPTTSAAAPAGREIATLAGGCFWCTEAMFTELKGVDAAVPGYAGGFVKAPSYEQVCTGTTGHAEAVQVTFDPKVISFSDLLRILLTVHDPTTLNRQGEDKGTQYRSEIFTHGPEQATAAREAIAEVEAAKAWDRPIVTEVTPFSNFYAAEEYHRDYFRRNPAKGYCAVVIAPKVAHLREMYSARLKKK
jgi:peptide-methionine (S)-S-oxide reductase